MADNKKEVERAELHRTIWAIADEIMRILWGSNTSGTINITSTLPMGEADEEKQSENILKPTIIRGEKPIHDFDSFCKSKESHNEVGVIRK